MGWYEIYKLIKHMIIEIWEGKGDIALLSDFESGMKTNSIVIKEVRGSKMDSIHLLMKFCPLLLSSEKESLRA